MHLTEGFNRRGYDRFFSESLHKIVDKRRTVASDTDRQLLDFLRSGQEGYVIYVRSLLGYIIARGSVGLIKSLAEGGGLSVLILAGKLY